VVEEYQVVGAPTRIERVIRHPRDAVGTGTQGNPKVSVVIPTLNEAKNLPYVFTRLPRDVYEVILVDGHSRDNTVEVARDLYPEVKVVAQDGRGKGNALACGFAAATGDIIVMVDADGSADPAEISRFVAMLFAGADFVKGSRFSSGGGSADITLWRRFGNWMLNFLVNTLYGTRYSDLCYGYNAFWRYCLPHLKVEDTSGFEVETVMNIRAAKAHLVVHEVPSFEGHRVHGASNLRALRDGLRVLRTVLTEYRDWSAKKAPVREAPRGYGWDGVERRRSSEASSAGARTERQGSEERRGYGRRASDRSVLPESRLAGKLTLEDGASHHV
jgi:glycosyltransferase involved in cell wall biosynthesis